jgi:hypothetical protein
MADGITHDLYLRKNWIVIIPLGIFLFLLKMKEPYAYLYPLFLYWNYNLCRYINPDDDLFSLSLAEGLILRTSKKYYLGFFGALLVADKFMYAYIAGLFGGHRSLFSHGLLIGTIGRMLFYNIQAYVVAIFLYSNGSLYWDWQPVASVQFLFYFDQWGVIFLTMQFAAWFYADAVHLILDSEYAKGRFYDPKKIKTYKDTT